MGSRTIQGRQMGFVQDLFEEAGSVDIGELRKRYNVSKLEFEYWLKDERFLSELRRRISWAYQRSEILVAKYCIVAASKLVQLTESENPETARRACLDIISLLRLQQKEKVIRYISERIGKDKVKSEVVVPEISEDKAAKLMALLAEG